MARLKWGGGLLAGVMVLLTAIGLIYTPHSPTAINIERRLESPSLEYPLGTDNYGRDILSRIMVGGRPAFQAGLISVALGLSLGTVWGAAAGYYRGWLEEILMRMADGLYSLPSVLMALLAVTLLGPGQGSILVAVTLANIPIFARLVRSQFLTLRERDFVMALRSLGLSDLRIISFHILPNCLPTLLVQASVSFAAAILAEASLSYLGLGTQPPHPSWGRMLKEAQSFAGLAPWAAIFPGLAIALTIFGFNSLGDSLRERLDPRCR